MAMTARPVATAINGRAPSSSDVSPYIGTHWLLRGGRSSGHGWWTLPDFTAGEPFQYWPFLILSSTPEPGATSAFLPTIAPGSSVVRAPTVASLPIVISP